MHSRSMTPFLPPSFNPGKTGGNFEIPGILSKLENLKTDDFILLGIIAVLFFEGSEDYILLAALGYLFIMGIL